MKTIYDLIAEHPFFRGMEKKDVEFISKCGKNRVFRENEAIAREGEAANFFYLIRQGTVAVITDMPPDGFHTLQTVSDGEIMGWSWLFPPYHWLFDLEAKTVVHAVELDGKCLRDKCEQDPKLGYELMKRFAKNMTDKLEATRLQLLDVYGTGKKGP